MIQRHIYEIIVVIQASGDIILDKKIVATSSEAAMAKINIQEACKEKEVTVDEVEYVILKLGSFRPVQETTNTEVNKF